MKLGCGYCKGDGPEPGFICMDNNGPIVGCPVCNPTYDPSTARRQHQFESAQRQRKGERT
jgi:hypothetical protein